MDAVANAWVARVRSKCTVLARICEGCAGVKKLIRLIHAFFYASLLASQGTTSLDDDFLPRDGYYNNELTTILATKPPFLLILKELLQKRGLHKISSLAPSAYWPEP